MLPKLEEKQKKTETCDFTSVTYGTLWHNIAIWAHFRYFMGFLNAKIRFLVQKYMRMVGSGIFGLNSDQVLGHEVH